MMTIQPGSVVVLEQNAPPANGYKPIKPMLFFARGVSGVKRMLKPRT